MLYDKNSFLPAVADGDMTIRLVDASGGPRYLVKDHDATLTVEGRTVRVHQRADTAPMTLDFPSPRDARDAMTLLQAALLKLRRNAAQPSTGGGGEYGVPDTLYITVSYERQVNFNLGFQPAKVQALYVNGQLVYANEYTIADAGLTWASAQYDLEPSDKVLLEYYGKLE